jgi:hypothetical protein
MTAEIPSTTHTIDIPYEITMLRAAYELYPKFSSTDPFLRNIIIESYWLHARNITEMMLGKRNATDPKAIAGANYAPLDQTELTAMYSLICAQISHLKDGRPVIASDKLDMHDPKYVNLIENEIAHFVIGVPEGIRPNYAVLPNRMLPRLLNVGPAGPSATNHVAAAVTGPISWRS